GDTRTETAGSSRETVSAESLASENADRVISMFFKCVLRRRAQTEVNLTEWRLRRWFDNLFGPFGIELFQLLFCVGRGRRHALGLAFRVLGFAGFFCNVIIDIG